MTERIKKTEEFLKARFEQSEYYKTHEEEKKYRIEHTYRVANIGKEIARKENLNEEALIVACLLHDLSYSEEFDGEDDWVNHGRNAAKIARPFLKELGFEPEMVEEICYGIAIHVDDKADFEGRKTPFAMSVGDADNIDRFDAYRIYEGLQYSKFSAMSLEEKKEKVCAALERLEKYKSMNLGTDTAKQMWIEKMNFQISFYEKLKLQFEASEIISLN
jgi:uncharacterized protein